MAATFPAANAPLRHNFLELRHAIFPTSLPPYFFPCNLPDATLGIFTNPYCLLRVCQYGRMAGEGAREFCHYKRLPPIKGSLHRKEEEQSPVSRWRRTLIVSAISPRRRSSPRPIISVGCIRILVPTARWSAVRIFAVAATSGGWVIVNRWASGARRRWRTVAAVARVVVITRWGTATVVIATGAVTPRGRWATTVIAVRWWIAAAAASTEWWGRARAVAVVAGDLVLGL